MRILITGANGQMGSELSYRGQRWGFEMLSKTRKDLDITQISQVKTAIDELNPDLVINAAAYTAVDKAEEEQQQAIAINRDGAVNLALACADAEIPLFHISTDYVFDGLKSGAYTEQDSTGPTGVYGQSKLEGEQAVRKALKQHLVLRVSWVFGAHGNNFVRTMLRLAQERDELRIVADQKGYPTFAGDIAEVLLDLAARFEEEGKLKWGVYHFSGQPSTSWYGFAKEILCQAEKVGLINRMPAIQPIETADYPTPAKRPPNSELDCSLMEQTFGIVQPDWRNGLTEVLKDGLKN